MDLYHVIQSVQKNESVHILAENEIYDSNW